MTEFKRISVKDARKIIDAGSAVVVDIRDPQSYAAGHILQAQHLDNSGVHQFIQEADLRQSVIVCCYHGNMSQPAAAYLAEHGFTEVYSLDGGFTQWQHLYPECCEFPNSA